MNSNSPTQKDFFIADPFNTKALQLHQSSMEFPLFSLRARDVQKRVYFQNGLKVKIEPNPFYGMATVHDKDVWIYCISKLIQAMREGKEIDRTVHFTIYDYLVTTNRGIGGSDYQRAKDSLDRLLNTRVTIDIETNDIREYREFGLIDFWKIDEEKNGKMIRISVTLPSWLYRSVISKNVLKIHEDYFRIRRPLDRRIYEIANKHCGYNDNWQINLETLHERSGSSASLKEFKRSVKELVKKNHLPGYIIEFNDENDNVFFVNRSLSIKEEIKLSQYISLSEFELDVYEKGMDIYDVAVAVVESGRFLSKEVQNKYKEVILDGLKRKTQYLRKVQEKVRDESDRLNKIKRILDM